MRFKQPDEIVGMDMQKPGKLRNGYRGGQMAVHVFDHPVDIPFRRSMAFPKSMIAFFLCKQDVSAD